MNKKLIILALLPLLLCGCNDDQTDDAGNTGGGNEEGGGTITKVLALHGNGEPANTLGQDFDYYVDEDTNESYCKENSVWIPTGTLANESFYETVTVQRSTRASKLTSSNYDLYKTIMDTLLCTNGTYNLKSKINGLGTTYHKLSFNGGYKCQQSYASLQNLTNNIPEETYYSKYSSGHYYFKEDSTYVLSDNGPYTVFNGTCIDKFFEQSASLNGGISGLIIGEEYTKTGNKIEFKNIWARLGVLSEHYSSYNLKFNVSFNLDSALSKVNDFTLTTNFSGTFKEGGASFSGSSTFEFEVVNLKQTSLN